MAKYQVIGLISATIIVGEYEAKSAAAAIKKAENDPKANSYCTLCHQCAKNIEMGEVYTLVTEEI